MIALTILIIVFLGAFMVCGHIASRRNVDLANFEKYALLFYENSAPLISDDETPSEILKILETINWLISHKKGAKILQRTIKSTPFSNNKNNNQLPDEIEFFFKRRKELRNKFDNSIACGFLCVTFSSWRGIFIRAELAKILDEKSKKSRVNIAAKVQKELNDNNYCDGALMPA